MGGYNSRALTKWGGHLIKEIHRTMYVWTFVVQYVCVLQVLVHSNFLLHFLGLICLWYVLSACIRALSLHIQCTCNYMYSLYMYALKRTKYSSDHDTKCISVAVHLMYICCKRLALITWKSSRSRVLLALCYPCRIEVWSLKSSCIYIMAYTKPKCEQVLVLASRRASAWRFIREYSSTQTLVLDCCEYSHARALARSRSVISRRKAKLHRSTPKCTIYTCSSSKLEVMPLSLCIVYIHTFMF